MTPHTNLVTVAENPLFRRLGTLRAGDTLTARGCSWQVVDAKYGLLGGLKRVKVIPVISGRPLPIKPITLNKDTVGYFQAPERARLPQQVGTGGTLRFRERHSKPRTPKLLTGPASPWGGQWGSPQGGPSSWSAPTQPMQWESAVAAQQAGGPSSAEKRREAIGYLQGLKGWNPNKATAAQLLANVPSEWDVQRQVQAALKNYQEQKERSGDVQSFAPSSNPGLPSLPSLTLIGLGAGGIVGWFLYQRHRKQVAEAAAQAANAVQQVALKDSDLVFSAHGNPSFTQGTRYTDPATAAVLNDPTKFLMHTLMIS